MENEKFTYNYTAGDHSFVIEVKNATKDYGNGRGIFNVSFEVDKGEVLGYLGPNGAGKTTTIRHLMGFSRADNGECFVNGLNCKTQSAKIMKSVGYLPGEIALPENLTGEQFVNMMSGLRNCDKKEYVAELCKIFQLDLKGKTKRMSLGNKRKLALVTAFMNDPQILILDEPTSGLDPVMQDNFIKFLKTEKERGKTILLSSHIFSEVDAICDRVVVIKDGKIASTVNVDDIRHNQDKMYEITFDTVDACRAFDYENKDNENLTIAYTYFEKNTCVVSINDKAINTLIKALVKYSIVNFVEKKFTLESYFMKFYLADKSADTRDQGRLYEKKAVANG
jgi:ABC-2 type transport system ATP-binding protein